MKISNAHAFKAAASSCGLRKEILNFCCKRNFFYSEILLVPGCLFPCSREVNGVGS